MLTPAIRAIFLLALSLLVTGVRADHEDPAVTPDDLALLTHRLDRRSYLHDPFRSWCLMIQSGWLWRPVRSPLPSPGAGLLHADGPPGLSATAEYSAVIWPLVVSATHGSGPVDKRRRGGNRRRSRSPRRRRTRGAGARSPAAARTVRRGSRGVRRPWCGRARRGGPWRRSGRALRRGPAACRSGSHQRRAPGLEVEQRPLGRQPAAVAGERAVGADHAVARHDDRDRVLAVGGADGAERGRVPDLAGDLAVGGGLPVRDLQQRIPDQALERRALGPQRDVELRARAREVLGELA